MKLIIGLGNIGEKYEGTRHNSGFALVESISRDGWREDKKQEVLMARLGDILLIKPTTFMNESGRAVRKVMDFYKIGLADMVLVHDDLDIKLGEYKIQMGVGPKVHNGVASVEECVGSSDFLRVRLGVDSREVGVNYGSGADYVLAKLQPEERRVLDSVFEKAIAELKTILKVD